jgi:hypothetical protein
MRDSSTYQAILAEGRGEGELNALQRILRRQGQDRFGSLRPEDEKVLNGITVAARLERMIDQAAQVADWNELLGTL